MYCIIYTILHLIQRINHTRMSKKNDRIKFHKNKLSCTKVEKQSFIKTLSCKRIKKE